MRRDPPEVQKYLRGEEPPKAKTPIGERAASVASGTGKIGLRPLLGGCLGMVILSFLLGVGLVVFLVVNTRNAMRQYAETQIPIGGEAPDWVRQSLTSNERMDPREIEGLDVFLSRLEDSDTEIEEIVDYGRMVREMEASGQSEVNFLTRAIWNFNIRDSVELPQLGSEYALIAADWMQPGRELRIAVAGTGNGRINVYFLYLCRHESSWKLYDWRDVLEPLSESQYYSVYSSAPLGIDENYSDLVTRLWEIRESEDSDSEKAEASVRAFESLKYPRLLRSCSLSYTASMLRVYRDATAMSSLLAQGDDAMFTGMHYYRASLAEWRKDKSQVFNQSHEIIRKVGWHPLASVMAYESAQSKEERQLAEGWMLRTADILPDLAIYYAIIRNDTDLMEQMIARMAEQPFGQKSLLYATWILDAMPRLSQFYRALPKVEEGKLDLISNYAKLKLFQFDTSIDARQMGRRILESPHRDWFQSVKDQNYSKIISEVQYLTILDSLRSQTLTELLGEDDVQPEVKLELLDHLVELIRYGNPPPNNVLPHVIESLQMGDPEFLQQAATQGVLGLLYLKTRQPEPAWQALSAAWSASENPESEEDVNTRRQIGIALGRLAVLTGQWQELVDVIHPPTTALTFMGHSMYQMNNWDSWEDVRQWYLEQKGTQETVWLDYYSGLKACSDGDFSKADMILDRAITKAQTEAEATKLSEEDQVETMIAEQLYDQTLMDFLETTRLEIAVKTGQFAQLMHSKADEAQWLENSVPTLQNILRGVSDADTLEQIADRLEPAGENVLSDVHAFRAEAALNRRNPELAFEFNLLELSSSHPEDMKLPAEDYAIAAVSRGVEVDQVINGIRKLEGSVLEPSIQELLQCMAGDDAKQLGDLLLTSKHESSLDEWVELPELRNYLIRSGNWLDINRRKPLKCYFGPHGVHGVVLLDCLASDVIDTVTEAISSVTDKDLEPHSVERFPFSTAVWSVEMESGRLIIAAYDMQDLTPYFHLNELMASHAGCLAVILQQTPLYPNRSSDLRQWVCNLAEFLPPAIGYYDSATNTRFLGSRWSEVLKENHSTGFNPFDTVDVDTPWRQWGIALQQRDQQVYLHLSYGLIVEEVPVRTDLDVRSLPRSSLSPWEQIVELEREPLLAPTLPKGSWVIDR